MNGMGHHHLQCGLCQLSPHHFLNLRPHSASDLQSTPKTNMSNSQVQSGTNLAGSNSHPWSKPPAKSTTGHPVHPHATSPVASPSDMPQLPPQPPLCGEHSHGSTSTCRTPATFPSKSCTSYQNCPLSPYEGPRLIDTIPPSEQ